MAYSARSPRQFLLMAKICCSPMEKDVDRILETTPGVQSFRIDRNRDTVRISGTAEPSRIMTLLRQRVGLNSELLWDQISPTATAVGLPVSNRRDDELNVTVQLKRGQGSVEIKLTLDPEDEPLFPPPPSPPQQRYAPSAPIETDDYYYHAPPPPPPPATSGSVFDQHYDEGRCMIM